tara:strand:- start:8149 stop:8739 length:591 start_codon:yes stop_codon:yes gene_type:complete
MSKKKTVIKKTPKVENKDSGNKSSSNEKVSSQVKTKAPKPQSNACLIKVKKLHDNATIPVRAHKTDAGLDLFTLEGFQIQRQERKLVSTGIAVQIPKGHVGFVKEKSGLASRGIEINAGVIDEGYTGELKLLMVYPEGFMFDESDKRIIRNGKIMFEAGDKIAQLVVLPVNSSGVLEVSDLDDSDRGSSGFGSSGA